MEKKFQQKSDSYRVRRQSGGSENSFQYFHAEEPARNQYDTISRSGEFNISAAD
jgi:hypothetical protein